MFFITHSLDLDALSTSESSDWRLLVWCLCPAKMLVSSFLRIPGVVIFFFCWEWLSPPYLPITRLSPPLPKQQDTVGSPCHCPSLRTCSFCLPVVVVVDRVTVQQRSIFHHFTVHLLLLFLLLVFWFIRFVLVAPLVVHLFLQRRRGEWVWRTVKSHRRVCLWL